MDFLWDPGDILAHSFAKSKAYIQGFRESTLFKPRTPPGGAWYNWYEGYRPWWGIRVVSVRKVTPILNAPPSGLRIILQVIRGLPYEEGVPFQTNK